MKTFGCATGSRRQQLTLGDLGWSGRPREIVAAETNGTVHGVLTLESPTVPGSTGPSHPGPVSPAYTG